MGAAAKVAGAVAGNFAGLDADGNLTDSGKKAADFALSDTGDGVAASAAKLKTARNLTVGNTTRPFDGTENVGWTIDDIGVLDAAYGRGTSIPEGSDLNAFVTPGNYYCVSSAIAATLLNCPSMGSGFKMLVFQTTSNIAADPWLFQLIVSHNVGISSYSSFLFVRGCRGSANGFASWAKLLTPIVDSDATQTLTLLNGYTGWIRYSKTAIGLVVARFSIIPGTVAAGTNTSVLPSGYRPAVICPVQLTNNSNLAPANFRINSSGSIYNVDALTAGVTYTGSIAFLAE